MQTERKAFVSTKSTSKKSSDSGKRDRENRE